MYGIIEPGDGSNTLSKIYDYIMIVTIIVSVIPLFFKHESTFFRASDKVTVSIFIIDYLLRLITADYKYSRKKVFSFIRYPFSFMAIIDLIAILPSVSIVNNSLKLFKMLRMARAMRVLRIFKTFRYSKNIAIIVKVFNSSKEALSAVCMLAALYIVVSALIVFNVEPNSFNNFFEAIYWATVSLTTVGYGDIYPVSTAGRIVTMISSVFGIAIVALPAGIITAGYMNEINNKE
ncbi:UNVERIFIED_CONTAM: voltage-gated potassium channel [Murimonas intestini]|uniref:Voltage-gated potassium channel n=2 Tax=Murimonas intestini TaxID=1337051 RepID=A0AB73T8A7_9FIRM